jgi:hypothetical protein
MQSTDPKPDLPSLDDLRCDDCAFREGTEANKYEMTRLKAQLCAEIPEEFQCHRRDGLCAGWVALTNKLNAEGFHAHQQPWQRKLKETLLECIRRIEHGENIDIIDEVREFIRKGPYLK